MARAIKYTLCGLGSATARLAACPQEYRLWHPDQNLSDMLRVLDSAAASGVPVLLNIGIDSLASKTYNKTYNTSGGLDPRIAPARTDLTDCRGEPYCEWIREGVLAFRDHPAWAWGGPCKQSLTISRGRGDPKWRVVRGSLRYSFIV